MWEQLKTTGKKASQMGLAFHFKKKGEIMNLSSLNHRELEEFGYSQKEIFEEQMKFKDALKIQSSLNDKFKTFNIISYLQFFKKTTPFFINEELLMNLKNKQLLISMLLFAELAKNKKVKCFDFYTKHNFDKSEFYKTLKKINKHLKQFFIKRISITTKTGKSTFFLEMKFLKNDYVPFYSKQIKFNSFSKIVLCLLLNDKKYVSFLRMTQTSKWDNDDFQFDKENVLINEKKT
ncbi:hypothetical protein [Mycoplasmoides gallisepticum]|uniref:hypothetical protein n=1 Tax=Mycoplasmoides gallisepticum TaxID=2096 RepID=UPI00334CB3CE